MLLSFICGAMAMKPGLSAWRPRRRHWAVCLPRQISGRGIGPRLGGFCHLSSGGWLHLSPDRAKTGPVFCAGKLANDFSSRKVGTGRCPGGPGNRGAGHRSLSRQILSAGSGSSGWAPNAARSYVADDIFGPWRATGNPCIGFNPYTGMGADRTFGAQISFIFPVAGKDGEFIAMFDVWKPERLSGRYVWLPLTLENGKPIIQWHDQWDLSLFAREK